MRETTTDRDHFQFSTYIGYRTTLQCVSQYLDRCLRADYFELILITFKASSIFVAAEAVAKIYLCLKSNHHCQIDP